MATRIPPAMAGSGVTTFGETEAPAADRPGIGQRVSRLDRWLAAKVQRSIDAANVRLELWDGSSPHSGPNRCIGAVVRDRRTLLGLALHPDLCFGEAYMAGRMYVRGSVPAVFEAMSRASLSDPSWRERIGAVIATTNTERGSRRNVHHHYDLGNDFYERWLDSDLVYTCAYFADPAMSLDEAQRAKLDLVCRKLRLRPGERVAEAGCGWGALALHMARHYGVHVKAFNVSREQLATPRPCCSRRSPGGSSSSTTTTGI